MHYLSEYHKKVYESLILTVSPSVWYHCSNTVRSVKEVMVDNQIIQKLALQNVLHVELFLALRSNVY